LARDEITPPKRNTKKIISYLANHPEVESMTNEKYLRGFLLLTLQEYLGRTSEKGHAKNPRARQ
jgi:hypothetical protein